MTLKQVFIINQDLKMGKGKIAVQIAHGEVYFMELAFDEGYLHPERYESWRNDDDELMKKVVLKATEDQLHEIVAELCFQKIWCSTVYDHGLTQIPEDSFTCIVVEPLLEEQCDKLFGNLKLL